MTRMKYVIALMVVLSAYRRLGDAEFIIRSFHDHGLSTSRRILVEELAPRADVVGTNITAELEEKSMRYKKDTGTYDVGQFCPYCTWSTNHLCIDRVVYMKERYKTPDADAKNSLMPLCATPPILHKFHAEEDEPSIVLHAGPHKTGTTALQAFIYDLKYTNDTVFQLENLRVPAYEELPGVFAKEGVGLNLPHCSLEAYKNDGGQNNIGMCDRMRKAFPRFILDAYNKSQNVLIVAEDFDRKEINFKRLRFFLQPYKKVHVVVTYRRLHDWLPSYYNQIMEHYSLVYAMGEEPFPSFVEWLAKNYDDFLKAHSIQVAERFRSYDIVKSVDVYNMHEHNDVIKHFFCDHLQANAVCHVINDGAQPSKSNVGRDHEYDRILIKASHGGKVSVNFHKPVALVRGVRHLTMRVKEMNITLPRMCPPTAILDKILQTEMEHEKTYFIQWYRSQGGDDGLRKSFHAAVDKKFCPYDVDKIFERGLLDSIFEEFHP